MKFFKLSIYLFLLLLSHSFFGQASKTILFEGFNNNDNNWPTKFSNDVTLNVTGGDYIIDHKRSTGGWVGTSEIKFDTSRDFRIAAQIKKVSGIQNNGFGLVYGRRDNDNQNMFLISGNGSYKIVEFKNGNERNIKSWTASDKIKQNNGSLNYLTIKKIGSKIDYYINSTVVCTSYTNEFFGDYTGFAVYDNQKISVAYLSMEYQDTTTITTTNNDHTVKESIMFDGYTNNSNNWSVGNTSDYNLNINNGDYNFEHKRKSGGWSTTISEYIDTSRDFKIEAQIKKISGTQYNGYGIIFAGKDNDNQNLFYVNANGSYSINIVDNGTSNRKKSWEKSSAIRKGNGSYNTLKVVKIGSNLEYYINNTKVYTDYSPKFFGNKLGYVLYDDQKVGVGYLSVGYLDKKSNVTTTVTNFSSDNVSPKTYSDYDFSFSEQFNNNTNNWSFKDDANAAFKVMNGKYYMLHKRSEKGWSSHITKTIDTNQDFEIETKIDKISGVVNFGYGLMFGKNGDNSFRFYIASNGYYRIVREVKGNDEDIIKWTSTAYVNKGNQESNILKVKKEGRYYKFYVNDNYLTQIDYEPFFGNEIGYVLYNNQEIGIDYLRFKYNTTNKDVVTYKKLTAPVFDGFDNNSNGWAIDNTNKFSSDVKSGKLVVDRKESGGIFINKDLDLDTNRDFIIKTSITTNKYGGTGMYGITFGRKNSSNEYSFLISPNGSYKYRKFDNDQYKSIIPFTNSNAIKIEDNQSNEIKIIKSGKLLRFYVNGTYLNEAPFEPFYGNQFGFTVYHSQRIYVDYLDINYQTDNFNEPPVVVITEPVVELKRGFEIVKTKDIIVKGKATDKDGIYEVKINDVDARIKEDGTFMASVPLKVGSNDLVVTVKDLKQAISTKTFVVRRQTPDVIKDDVVVVINDDKDKNDDVDIGFGKYYALIIGVSDYGDSNIDDLAGLPTKDASDLANVLEGNYSFKKENITLLNESPTANEIKVAFATLRKKVTENDNVLIFYAGHGIYDEETDLGSWLPSDANPEMGINMISNSEIKDYIKSIKAKHTLLISDACFSGSILRRLVKLKEAPKSVKAKYSLPSRKAMTSGTLKTVPNKSVFLKYLIKRLTNNPDNFIAARQLFNSLQDAVINNSDNNPQFGVVGETGDEGGDFIFVRN